MLKVVVDGDNDLPFGGAYPTKYSIMLSKVASKFQANNPFVLLCNLLNRRPRFVTTRVIDKDNLEITPPRFDNRYEARMKYK